MQFQICVSPVSLKPQMPTPERGRTEAFARSAKQWLTGPAVAGSTEEGIYYIYIDDFRGYRLDIYRDV